jgi:predicted glutamine amidotransferase
LAVDSIGPWTPLGSSASDDRRDGNRGVPSIRELTLTLKELAGRIAPHGTFNFLLSNGQALWAHASTHLYYIERRHPFGEAQLSDEDVRLDFSRETQEKDEVAVIVTSPLTTNESWTAFGRTELLVFAEGRRVDI